MLIEKRLQQILVPGTVSALYPLIAPDQTEPPYTTYLLFTSQNLTTHTSPLPATRMWHVQLNVYHPTYGVTREIGDAIQSTLVGYTDPYILGISPMRVTPSWDDIAKLYCTMVEVIVTEQLLS